MLDWPALLGGILIGISSSTMLGGLGRITGISGIVGQVLSAPSSEHTWRYAFLFGLLTAPFLYRLYETGWPNYSLEMPWWQWSVGGLLVGFGTRLGGGCTSGHGVCGMARLARRSWIATILFVASGMITVALKGLL